MWSAFRTAFSALLLPGLAPAVADLQDNNSIKQVAIIGAGAAGSSAAYHLAQYAQQDGVSVNITIFEKTDRIGGRTLTIDVYDDPLEPVELGASIFIKLNHIMWNAANDFGLELRPPYEDTHDDLMVVWDGEQFLFRQLSSSWQWWQLLKMFWKYGQAPYKAQQLMKKTVTTFLKLYDAPNFPFRSLTARVYELGLVQATGMTGWQYLDINGIGNDFSQDLIQAATRVNYASNLDQIHGLETMVSIAPEGAVAVQGGNWQIFDTMVASCGAVVLLNTTVSSIDRVVRAPGSAQEKYTISTKDAESTANSLSGIRFDSVILANPYQFSGIAENDDVFHHAIDEIPYVRLHVTLFTTPLPLHYGYFGLSAADKVPTTVLTTLKPGEDSTSGSKGAGSAGFFSISTLRTVINPVTLQKEYLYKIFSPDKVNSTLLGPLLGIHLSEQLLENGNHDSGILSWYHAHVFDSYAKGLPRVTFQDPVLGPGVYYTSGIESFISTMETSALMGKNVARLIVDDFLDASQLQESGHYITDEL